MDLVGYARVSSIGQSLEVQEEQLRSAGCNKLFSEKVTGTTTAGRSQLAAALEYLREGDVLVVTRMDRLSRSLVDLRNLVDSLTERGVGFRALQQAGIDTTRPEGKLMVAMLGAFAEFETDIRKERQREGIVRAKAKGVYNGRKPSVPVDDVIRLASEGRGATEIAVALSIGRASVYRALRGVQVGANASSIGRLTEKAEALGCDVLQDPLALSPEELASHLRAPR